MSFAMEEMISSSLQRYQNMDLIIAGITLVLRLSRQWCRATKYSMIFVPRLCHVIFVQDRRLSVEQLTARLR
jgi:hypothetical protein